MSFAYTCGCAAPFCIVSIFVLFSFKKQYTQARFSVATESTYEQSDAHTFVWYILVTPAFAPEPLTVMTGAPVLNVSWKYAGSRPPATTGTTPGFVCSFVIVFPLLKVATSASAPLLHPSGMLSVIFVFSWPGKRRSTNHSLYSRCAASSNSLICFWLFSIRISYDYFLLGTL